MSPEDRIEALHRWLEQRAAEKGIVYFCSSGGCCHGVTPTPENLHRGLPAAVEISTEHHHDGWGEPVRRGDLTIRHCDGLRTLLNRFTGWLEQRRIRRYYTETLIEHRGPGDYCGYCGSFNGPHGEYREGWDCYHCNSN